jgi:hypothetical protein
LVEQGQVLRRSHDNLRSSSIIQTLSSVGLLTGGG